MARGLGFDGVYLGGHTPAATFGEIVDLADGFAPDDWRSFVAELRYPFDDEFCLFEPDPDTGLSSDTVSPAYLESKRQRRTDLRVPFSYRVSRRMHDRVFAPEAPSSQQARSRGSRDHR